MLARVRRALFTATLKVDDSKLDEVLLTAWRNFGDPTRPLGGGSEFDKIPDSRTEGEVGGLHPGIPQTPETRYGRKKRARG